MQADRVTGGEPAGAKAGAGSVTGARCAPNGETMCRIVTRGVHLGLIRRYVTWNDWHQYT